MTPIEVDTTGADFVVGHLYGPEDVDGLCEDMLVAKIGEYGIDVGWYPEADPDGRYVVRCYKSRFSNRLGQPLETRDAVAVKDFIEGWVRAELARFGAPRPAVFPAPVGDFVQYVSNTTQSGFATPQGVSRNSSGAWDSYPRENPGRTELRVSVSAVKSPNASSDPQWTNTAKRRESVAI